MFFEIPDHQQVVVEGLPYGLIMNKTTLEKAKVQFKKYNAKVQKRDSGSEFPGGAKLVFKREKHFIILLFDGENLLKSLKITTEPVDTSVN